MMLSHARDPSRAQNVIKCGEANQYDKEMFGHTWKPTVTALCHVLDTTMDTVIIQNVLDSLQKCATICSRFELYDVFDNLVVSLCKRTLMISSTAAESESLEEEDETTFVSSSKAQFVAQTVFTLARDHGNIMRHGWEYILDVILNLFKGKLLPNPMTQVTGFLSMEWSLLPAEVQDDAPADTSWGGLFGFASRSASQEVVSAQQTQEHAEAKECVLQCRITELFSETAFLQDASLTELLKYLVCLSRSPTGHKVRAAHAPAPATRASFAAFLSCASAYQCAPLLKIPHNLKQQMLDVHFHGCCMSTPNAAVALHAVFVHVCVGCSLALTLGAWFLWNF